MEQLKINSKSFQPGNMLPEEYSYKGGNISPQLSWSEGPAGTKSYLVICQDPDAVGGIFTHWVVFDIPNYIHSLDQNLQKVKTDTYQQTLNDYGEPGWGGPNPPKGATHKYIFYVYALDDMLALDTDKKMSKAHLEKLTDSSHVLAVGLLMATYKTI